MKPSGPPSLRVQAIAILTFGLIISHSIGLFLYSLDRRAAVADTEALDVVERAAGVIVLVRNVPEDWRDEVMAAADSRSFRVWRTRRPALVQHDASDDDEQALAFLRTLLPGLDDREMRVSVDQRGGISLKPPPRVEPPGAPTASGFDAAAKIVTISIHHPQGFWVNFMGAVPKPEKSWPGVFSLYLAATVLGVAFVAFWLVRRVTRPLEAFAEASDRLGKDLKSPPLDQKGPKEIAQATLAFNLMRERLLRLIENRVELLAAISHDLRTPITRLKLHAELIDDADLRAKFSDSLEEMEGITSTFLDYARSSYGGEERSKVELGSLVESICIDFADRGAAVEFESGAPLKIHCKRGALRRAVSNVVDNSVKYAGGALASVRMGEGVGEIIVADRGPGVPDAELQDILAPFVRGDPSRNKETGGAGLGLSIAQAIAHDHGGEVLVENRADGGLSVTIRLPL